MKKYLSFMAFAMMAVFSLTLVSCGDNDDELDGFEYEQIEVNGKKATLTGTIFTYLGDDYYYVPTTAMFSFGTLNNDSYLFQWYSPNEPKKGDVISDMKNFYMEPDVTGQVKDVKYTYSSGAAKIIDANVAKEEITVQFNNLKKVNGSNSFTFNGTITFGFDFSELHAK